MTGGRIFEEDDAALIADVAEQLDAFGLELQLGGSGHEELPEALAILRGALEQCRELLGFTDEVTDEDLEAAEDLARLLDERWDDGEPPTSSFWDAWGDDEEAA